MSPGELWISSVSHTTGATVKLIQHIMDCGEIILLLTGKKTTLHMMDLGYTDVSVGWKEV